MGKKSKATKVSTHSAPSMQGMGQTSNWDLINVVPILTNGGGSVLEPYLW